MEVPDSKPASASTSSAGCLPGFFRRFNTLPVLLTGFKDREKLQPLLKQENTDFMAKPFILELLRQKVKDKLFPNSHVEAVAE